MVICPLCRSREYEVVYPRIGKPVHAVYSPSNSPHSNEEIVRCKKCSIVYKTPFPKKKDLKGYEDNIDTLYLSLIKEREESFSRTIALIEKYHKPARILDIGCAEATFLNIARKNGWGVYGVEPNKYFIKWAKEKYNLNLLPSIFSRNLKKDFFDVITALDVIEHVPNPQKFLERCHQLMKKDSLLFLSFPDFDSLPSKVLRRKWFYILSIHLFYFNKKTISRLLEKSGFKVIKIKPYMLKTSLDYFLNKSKGYIGPLGSFLSAIAKVLKLNNLNLTYWLGQSIVIASKK